MLSSQPRSEGPPRSEGAPPRARTTVRRNIRLVAVGNSARIPVAPAPVLSGLLPRRQIQVNMSRLSTGTSRVSSSRSNVKKDRLQRGEQYELLEYEFPDLPPIHQIKDAVVRSRICTGMAYILPVDKGKNGVENVYRTDLRYMFKEPYRNNLVTYNDSTIRTSAQHHFEPNTPSEKYNQSPDDYTKYVLNSDSEKIRKRYSYSAPPKGITGKLTTPNSEELKMRSNLYIPIKSKLPPEALKMKEEASKILHSVQENAEAEYDEHQKTTDTNKDSPGVNEGEKGPGKDPLTAPGKGEAVPSHTATAYMNLSPAKTNEDRKRVSFIGDASQKEDRDLDQFLFYKKALQFKSYEELKNAKLPKRPPLPMNLRSPYLSDEKNRDIWNWLTREEVVTEFGHFMKVCS